jgi:hypothetical protein
MGKTAVIIIHGVGEQKPMGTVSSFTQFFAGNFYRSKPDNSGELFELRRLSTFVDDPDNEIARDRVEKAKKEVPGYPPGIVFDEFYWVFHYHDTKLALVIRWILATIFNRTCFNQVIRLRRRLLPLLTAFAVVGIGVGLVIWGCVGVSHSDQTSASGASQLLKIIGGLTFPWVVSVIRPIFIGWVGDAARYFGPSPDNPIERQQIREAGIGLLKRLHDARTSDGKVVYDSMVLVGHSLGSVVPYDILLNYRAQINWDFEIDSASVLTQRFAY